MGPRGQAQTAEPEENDRRKLVRRRTELEARLIAHRCGWQILDDIGLKRTRRSLASVLKSLGAPDPAQALIRRR